MSKENVTAFFQKMQSDETLKKQFASIRSDLQQQMMTQLADKMVMLGVDSGLAFTTEDLRDMYKAMNDKANENRELSDDEVNVVAGGTSDGKDTGWDPTESLHCR